MEKKHQFAMLASIVHIVNGDWASLVHSLTEMDVIRPGTNIRRVTMVTYLFLCQILSKYSAIGPKLLAENSKIFSKINIFSGIYHTEKFLLFFFLQALNYKTSVGLADCCVNNTGTGKFLGGGGI